MPNRYQIRPTESIIRYFFACFCWERNESVANWFRWKQQDARVSIELRAVEELRPECAATKSANCLSK